MLTTEQFQKIETSSIEDAVAEWIKIYPKQVCFSTSLGQEDQVLTHIIAKAKLPVKIFTLDTGRLFYETYELIEKTNARYKINIEVMFPDANDVEKYVNTCGVNGFYESVENRKQCCHVRKVLPLQRALANTKVWITGLRSEQSENRNSLKKIEFDEKKQLYKFNPLLHWNFDEMIKFINEKNIPYNPLHDKNFISIGCAPCTRAIAQGENARAGRWWWEKSKKECGLHG